MFDIGETLIDETRAWSVHAQTAGVTRLTLFATLGALIERGEDHRRVWELLGVDPPTRHIEIVRDDFYPDALPCLHALAAAGVKIGLAGNQPAQAETELLRLGLPVSFIASSARWGVEKPSPEFFAYVVSKAGVAADQIAYIGDRVDNDVIPARRAGMFAVFVRRGPWGHLHAHRPEITAASVTIESLAELPALLSPAGEEVRQPDGVISTEQHPYG